jgi:hypothetical protein
MISSLSIPPERHIKCDSNSQRRQGFISPHDWDQPPEEPCNMCTQPKCICCRPGCACCTPIDWSKRLHGIPAAERSTPTPPRNLYHPFEHQPSSVLALDTLRTTTQKESKEDYGPPKSPVDPFPLQRQFSFTLLTRIDRRVLKPTRSPWQQLPPLATVLLPTDHNCRGIRCCCMSPRLSLRKSPVSPLSLTSTLSQASETSSTSLQPPLKNTQVPQSEGVQKSLLTPYPPFRWPFLDADDDDDNVNEKPIPLENSAMGPLGALINEINVAGMGFNPYRNMREMWASWVIRSEGGRPWIRRNSVARGVGVLVQREETKELSEGR